MTLKDKVYYCLKNFSDTRNSDITLMIRIWRMFHGEQLIDDSAVKLKDLYDLPREDDIKRERARVQNGDKEHPPEFVPTKWTIAKARKWDKDKWKAMLSMNGVEDRFNSRAFKTKEARRNEGIPATPEARNAFKQKPQASQDTLLDVRREE